MNAVLGLKESVYDSAEQSELDLECRDSFMQYESMKESVYDTAEQSWAFKAELLMQCWDCV